MSKLTYERAKQLYTPYDVDQLRHLCALRDVEIDRLRAENAKLISVLHEVEAEAVDAYLGLQHDCKLLSGELDDRFRKQWHEQVQNAKLRNQVRHMYECMCNIDADGNHECDSCEYENTEGKCDFERLMRALDPALHPDLEHKKEVDE